MTYHYKALGLAAAIALSPMAASAATVDINFQAFGSVADNGDTVNVAGAIAARDAFMGSQLIIGTENFEGFTACTGANAGSCASSPVGTGSPIVSSSVGNFSGIGPADDPGDSALDPTDEIIVRNDNMDDSASRYDVDGGSNWLDSNDLGGILWEIPGTSGLSKILKIAFFLTDVDDVRQVNFKFKLAGDVTIDSENTNITGIPDNNAPNGELQLVTMLFSAPVNIIDIEMIAGPRDGFGVDGIKVGTVPLPAAGWLMLAGFGALAALRRRKRAA